MFGVFLACEGIALHVVQEKKNAKALHKKGIFSVSFLLRQNVVLQDD